MLLRDSASSIHSRQGNKCISFVTIVGIGGLGKTALAQLVFNDDRIRRAFDIRMWVCVSDDFSMQDIFSKMLEKDGLNLEVLQKELRTKIEGKSYLLVLDDVWNENRNEWVALRDFFDAVGNGSRVLVTSRSKLVASVIENNSMYELQGLSEESSWSLFKRIAFQQGEEFEDAELVEIGKEVLKKCSNIPLSIRVIGSLLYGQEKSKWLSIKTIDLSKMGQGKEGIMPILKFSYYHLTPPLKSCFSYCALFPKDFVIHKHDLINLWLAQGCFEELQYDSRRIVDIGEEYFSILLQRCFFQDIEKDRYGEISSCKMHDLIHDLAQEVAGQEFVLMTRHPFKSKIRHLNIPYSSPVLFGEGDSSDRMKDLRTIVVTPRNFRQHMGSNEIKLILANCRRSRVLKLRDLKIEAIPNTLSNLVHLRYLDLSENRLNMLPRSITKLLNLQVLNLNRCYLLEELPEDLWKLVNLRQLDIRGCRALTHMPTGLGHLTCLHTLPVFVLGRSNSNKHQKSQLHELKGLTNLGGKFRIKLLGDYSYDAASAEGGYLVNKPHMKALKIIGETDERLLEGLEPHHKIRGITINGYKDIKLPRWAATLQSSFLCLVSLSFYNFPRLRRLPSLSQLQHLKYLKLRHILDVEFIEEDSGDLLSHQVSRTTKSTFFPALETITLFELPKLKGWWKDEIPYSATERGQDGSVTPSFPCLHTLKIYDCLNMTSFPGCPLVKEVELVSFNEGLKLFRKSDDQGSESESQSNSVSATPSSSNSQGVFYLEQLHIDNVGMINSLFVDSVVIEYLEISYSEIESLSGAGIQHVLTDLAALTISQCKNLELEGEGDEMMPWKALHTLGWLHLDRLPKVVKLPKGFQYLTSLQTLQIERCTNLEALPEWFDSLRSLQKFIIGICPKIKSLPVAISRLPSLIQLSIWGSDDLIERCRNPNGEDWPKIRHIPKLSIGCIST